MKDGDAPSSASVLPSRVYSDEIEQHDFATSSPNGNTEIDGSKRFTSLDGEGMNEQSPLLQGSPVDGGLSPITITSDDANWEDGKSQETKSPWYMFLLTVGGFGLQMGWSVEMSNGSPYLLSLGLSKTMLAFVWIAGPLSGVLAQPYVGIKSDRSRNKWGKRRPYLLGGALATILSLMILAWTREIVSGVLGLFGVPKDSDGVAVTVMLFAVFFIYVLDFAINVLQAALRAFIVDCAPVHQQETANAWVSRMNGVGNIFGMFCGGVNLPKVVPFLGNSQFKVLCAIASLSMLITTIISCVTVRERDPSLDGEPIRDDGLIALFKDLYRAVTRLPPQIKRICEVQFMAWIGWFPFLFYTTTYIAEMYVDPIFEENPNLSQEEIDALWEKGTRRGTLALLIYSIVTFVSSVVLPFIIEPTYKVPVIDQNQTALTATAEYGLSSSSSFNGRPESLSSSRMGRTKNTLDAFLSKLQIAGFTLRKAWLIANFAFGICMLLTFFIRGVFGATLLVGIIGVPWALTQWAPFALISSEISKRDAVRRGLIKPLPTHDSELLAAGEDPGADQAGVVLGIHNVAISAPQVLATLISSLIFKLLSKPRGTPGDNSVAWCMRFGGICALISAYLITRVGEDKEGLIVEAAGAEDRRALLASNIAE